MVLFILSLANILHTINTMHFLNYYMQAPLYYTHTSRLHQSRTRRQAVVHTHMIIVYKGS